MVYRAAERPAGERGLGRVVSLPDAIPESKCSAEVQHGVAERDPETDATIRYQKTKRQ
jgi:hypothetical protein